MRLADRMLLPLAGPVGPRLIRSLYSTLKFDVAGVEHLKGWKSGDPVVFVGWHGRLLPLFYLFRGRGIVMLVSQHRDGEYLARVGHGLGYDAVRGSSTRGGGLALRALVRRVRSGESLAVTPDGPVGPMEQLKPGVLQVARLAEVPIVPVLAGCERAWWVEGWDRFMIPKPFATVQVAVGRPRVIARSTPLPDLAYHARALEAEMVELKLRVDGAVAGRAGNE